MGRNLHVYIARFFGDLCTLLVSGVALIPLAYSYIGDMGWLTSSGVKWGTLGTGFLIASYRIWRRAELARTSDSLDVLAKQANQIYMDCRYLTEFFGWPPTFTDGTRVKQPFKDYTFGAEVIIPPIFREMAKMRSQITAHRDLVRDVLKVHNLDPEKMELILDPDNLYSETMLIDLKEYLERLQGAAKPPVSLFQTWTTRRYQR